MQTARLWIKFKSSKLRTVRLESFVIFCVELPFDITEAKKYIYKWSDFERDQYESNEVDRMLEGYQRKSGILALAISLLLERDAIKENNYHQWIDSITLALTKWNEVGMNKYKANQSEKTIREAWVIFREYRVFPNTVESRLRA